MKKFTILFVLFAMMAGLQTVSAQYRDRDHRSPRHSKSRQIEALSQENAAMKDEIFRLRQQLRGQRRAIRQLESDIAIRDREIDNYIREITYYKRFSRKPYRGSRGNTYGYQDGKGYKGSKWNRDRNRNRDTRRDWK